MICLGASPTSLVDRPGDPILAAEEKIQGKGAQTVEKRPPAPPHKAKEPRPSASSDRDPSSTVLPIEGRSGCERSMQGGDKHVAGKRISMQVGNGACRAECYK